jgi:hypothetical protein
MPSERQVSCIARPGPASPLSARPDRNYAAPLRAQWGQLAAALHSPEPDLTAGIPVGRDGWGAAGPLRGPGAM